MNSDDRQQILKSGLFLWIFAVVGTGLVAVTELSTRNAIIDNERDVLLRNLNALLPADQLDNDITEDKITVPADALLGTTEPSHVYRARLGDEPVAAILSSIAPNGYSGRIHMLIGIYVDGSIAGVRVVKHAETPGLGDEIDIRKSDWVTGFDGKTLSSPEASGWAVKRDGGEFDQFTGATSTPRAVVAAVHRSLLYYQKNADMLFHQNQP